MKHKWVRLGEWQKPIVTIGSIATLMGIGWVGMVKAVHISETPDQIKLLRIEGEQFRAENSRFHTTLLEAVTSNAASINWLVSDNSIITNRLNTVIENQKTVFKTLKELTNGAPEIIPITIANLVPR
jgi:hypothetical protein